MADAVPGQTEDNPTEEPTERAGVKTRASNVKNRPGIKAYEALGLALPKTTKRRSSKEVAADKAAAIEAKAAKDADHQERVSKIARLEMDMEAEDKGKVMYSCTSSSAEADISESLAGRIPSFKARSRACFKSWAR